jgi:hypothetical protein
MKLSRVLSSCAVLMVAQVALAGEPARPGGQALGTVDGILSKCAQVDPADAARYRQQVELVTQGVSAKVVAEVRRTDEYQQSYDAITESLSQVSEEDAVKACTHSLAANK